MTTQEEKDDFVNSLSAKEFYGELSKPAKARKDYINKIGTTDFTVEYNDDYTQWKIIQGK